MTSLEEQIDQVMGRHGHQPDALIEVLHQVQLLCGYLPKPSLLQVARGLKLPFSRVYGVASFYHLFHLSPPATHQCQVCLGTACVVKGGFQLARQLEEYLGLNLGSSETSGDWSLLETQCLGTCGQAPALMVDGAVMGPFSVDDVPVLRQRFTEMALPEASPTLVVERR